MTDSTGKAVALRPDSSKITRQEGMNFIASKIGTESKAVNERIKNSVDSIINKKYKDTSRSTKVLERAENRERIVSSAIEKTFGIEKDPLRSKQRSQKDQVGGALTGGLTTAATKKKDKNRNGILYDYDQGAPVIKKGWGEQVSLGTFKSKHRNRLNKEVQTVSLWSDLVEWGMDGKDAYAAVSQLVGSELANNSIKKLFTNTEYEDVVAPKLGIIISEEI